MVADVYMYMVTLIPSLHSSSNEPPSLKISQFTAYANAKACIQFQEMVGRPDRAFWLKVADWTSVDWGTLDLPLYARLITPQVRRGNPVGTAADWATLRQHALGGECGSQWPQECPAFH